LIKTVGAIFSVCERSIGEIVEPNPLPTLAF